MGANESNPVRNLDKRTARRTYRRVFFDAIDGFRAELEDYGAGEDEWDGGGSHDAHDDDRRADDAATVRVFVRKRPIFKEERAAQEFDTITTRRTSVIVHDARMHAVREEGEHSEAGGCSDIHRASRMGEP